MIGYLMAFLGLMSPGLLTMTTLNTAIDKGRKRAVKFVIGAVIPIILQAHIALLGSEYLRAHPEIIKRFSKIAVFVFLILSVYFFHQYNKRKQIVKSARFSIDNSFINGLTVSLINPLAIPFYFTYTALLEMKGILEFKQPFISIFVAGAVLGAFSILSIYANNAPRLMSRLQFIARHFKLILAIVMFILSVAAFINAYKIW
jgi:threonine/homoserine/homoserine lactone efflux protein